MNISAQQKNRDMSLDFVKALLVLGMIIYHSVYVFMDDIELIDIIAGTWFQFVTGSWIFISGLIISTVYQKRFIGNEASITKRLWVRGLKLLVIFSSLNFIIIILGLGRVSANQYGLYEVFRMFFIGDGQLASFEILVGISYVLLIGPIFLRMNYKGIYLVICLFCLALLSKLLGFSLPATMWTIIWGLSGMIAGYAVSSRYVIDRYMTKSNRIFALFVSFVGVSLYFYLDIKYAQTKSDIYTYVPGIVCILCFTYLLYEWLPGKKIFNEQVRLMSHYSLVCYIGQMGIIHLLSAVIKTFDTTISYVAAVLLTYIFMILLVKLLDKLIAKIGIVRYSYRFIFG